MKYQSRKANVSIFSSKRSACKYLESKGWKKTRILDTDVLYHHPELPKQSRIVAKTSIRGVWRIDSHSAVLV